MASVFLESPLGQDWSGGHRDQRVTEQEEQQQGEGEQEGEDTEGGQPPGHGWLVGWWVGWWVGTMDRDKPDW